MKINKKLEIGIKAVNVLKNKTGLVRVSDLAVEVGTTTNFLEQVMRLLKASGIVMVKRGPGGGYMLNSARTVFTALDVANALGRLNEGLDLGDTSVTNRLRLSISEAFRNTTI